MLTHSSLGLCPNVSFPSPHSLPDTSSPFTSGANAWHPSTGVSVYLELTGGQGSGLILLCGPCLPAQGLA